MPIPCLHRSSFELPVVSGADHRPAGEPVLLSVGNLASPSLPRTAAIEVLERRIASAINAAIPWRERRDGIVPLARQLSEELGEITPAELDRALARAERRDFCVALLEGAFKDGLPSAAVTLAMNLAGTQALHQQTGSDMALAASYGAVVAGASVVLGHLLREWFAGAKYTAWPTPGERTPGDICRADWEPPRVGSIPYLAAVVGPATMRNVARGVAGCVLAGVGRRDLMPLVDNVIESAGSVVANTTTAVILAGLRVSTGADAPGFIFLRGNVRDRVRALQAGNASYVADLLKDSAAVARRMVGNVPGALRALLTPSALAQVGVLVGGVMLTTLVVDEIDRAIPDEPLAAREAATGAARAALLGVVYGGLALAALQANNAARSVVRGVRNVAAAPPCISAVPSCIVRR